MTLYGIIAIIAYYIVKYLVLSFLHRQKGTVSRDKHGIFNGFVLRMSGDYDQKYKHLKPRQQLQKLLSILSAHDLCGSDRKRISASIRLRELAESDILTEKVCAEHFKRMSALLSKIKLLLEMQPRDHRTVTWRYDGSYVVLSYDAQSILALFAKTPAAQADPILQDFLLSDDPDLVCVAAISLLSHGITLPPDIIIRLSSLPQTRNKIITAMEHHGLIEAVPAEYRTTLAIAESTFVEWLMFPTELASVPDEIALEEQVVIQDASNTKNDFYVFKFRTNPPNFAADQGWLLGISGPYKHDCIPDENSGGLTFSTFDKLGSITPTDLVVSHIKQSMELGETASP